MASHDIDWHQQPPPECQAGAVAIGNFDGAHLGHAALIAELARQARAVGGPAVALTFDPHPLALLRPEQALPRLTAPADRDAALHAHGADHVLTLHATHDLLALTAAEFFDEVIRGRLRARALVEGTNFGFGRGRQGTVDTLAALCRQAGLGLTVVPPVVVGDATVSSSRIRGLLTQGDVAAAAVLLGRPYRLRGIVVWGERRGRTIGFPTANLGGIATVVPADGVYAALAGDGEQTWPAAVNIGPNPTFGQVLRKVEAHLIGFQGDLYDRPLRLDFVDRLRDTRTFAGKDELVEQIRRDVEAARTAAS